jgi:serine/threonine protein kinase
MGNVAYMAPELYTDPTAAGAQTDIYALGIIFYELLTRKLPGRRSPMPSQINGSLPHGIDDIFDRMTRDDRVERYGSVDEILDDIDKLEGTEAILGRQNQILVGESPLSAVKFREGSEQPVSGTPVGEGGDDEDKKGGGGHRPFSFTQRRKKI